MKQQKRQKNHPVSFHSLRERYPNCKNDLVKKRRRWSELKKALEVSLEPTAAYFFLFHSTALFVSQTFLFVITEETERLRAELTQVRTKLEPWENQIIEHKGRLDVASAEKDLMKEKVGPPCPFLFYNNGNTIKTIVNFLEYTLSTV